MTGDWRKLRNEELHDLCCSQNIIYVIKSRNCDGLDIWHVWGRSEVNAAFWWGNVKERDHLEDVRVDGMISK